jgi:hypothetical protein
MRGSFATYAEAFPDAGEDDWAPWRDRHPELFDRTDGGCRSVRT